MSERPPRSVEEVRAQFGGADPRGQLWLVAEVGGRVVGGANPARGRWRKNAHTAEFGIAITREFRGLGIGEALLTAGLDWARSVDVRKVWLGVFATNDRAIRLYRRLGFEEEGRLRDQVVLDGRPVDEVFLARWIGPRPGPGATP